MSRVPSFRMRPRTPLAMRDWKLLNAPSLRPTRWPAARPIAGPAAFQGGDERRDEGRIVLPVAVEGHDDRRRARRSTPVRTAALWPQLSACRTTRSQGRPRGPAAARPASRPSSRRRRRSPRTGRGRRRPARSPRASGADVRGLVADRHDDAEAAWETGPSGVGRPRRSASAVTGRTA